MSILDILTSKKQVILEVKSPEEVHYTAEEIKVLGDLSTLRALKIIAPVPDDLSRIVWSEEELFVAIQQGVATTPYHVLIFSGLRNLAILPKIRAVFTEILV